MTDYGHDLLFGSFITPSNAAPERVVGLAQLSERAGLDLATFQDHPYQPSFLDTWTLLAWVAARTERIRLAPNVANLPLRPPAAGWSSGSAPARSGTASRRWAAPASRRGRASTRCPRAST